MVGTCFLLDADQSHLRVLISSPDADCENIVIVNITSWDESKDQSCILNKGDHPWIVKKSIVYYQKAFLGKLAELKAAKNSGLLKIKDNMEHGVLLRIWEGANNTQMLPRGCKKILKEHGHI